MRLTALKNTIAKSLVMIESRLKMWPPRLTVVCYHSISSGPASVQVPQHVFTSHITFLRQHFTFVSLDQVVSHIKSELLVTQPSIALTFDDGYKDALTTVAPFLAELDIPAAFFLLAQPESASKSITKHGQALMDSADIKKLHRSGFTIGCHTSSHINLAYASSSVYQAEIVESKQRLEGTIGAPIHYFAYPQGGYNKEVLSLCKAAGYKAAFSVKPGTISSSTNLLSIPRICISRFHTNEQVAALMSHTGLAYLNVFNKQEVFLSQTYANKI